MRINIIPVELLSDVHLKAEHYEIIGSIFYYKRSAESPMGIVESKISNTYTLNTGHAYMWYNKFGFIKERYELLTAEMKQRGFQTSAIEYKFGYAFDTHIPAFRRNGYTPTTWEMKLNIGRILERIHTKIYKHDKPAFYKLKGTVLSYPQWESLYEDFLKTKE